MKKYSVIGYDKDNDVYVHYGKHEKIVGAILDAKALTKQVIQGQLRRECSDGSSEPIDCIEVYKNWDGTDEQIVWSSYTHYCQG